MSLRPAHSASATRAFFRGRAIARFNDEISSIQWDEIVFGTESQSRRVVLPEAALDARLDALNRAARNGKDFGEFMKAMTCLACRLCIQQSLGWRQFIYSRIRSLWS